MPMICQAVISSRIYLTDGAMSRTYAGLNVVLIGFCLLLPWTFKETFTICIATITMYVIACNAHGGLSTGGVFSSNLYFLSITAVLAIVGTYFTNKLRVREFITRYELDQNKKQLEESNRKLMELDEAKSRFFANISHELRTPLTLLISPLNSLLQMKSNFLDEETKVTLSLMHNNAMRLLKLINDLLDLVRLDSKKMEVNKEPLEIQSFFRGLVQAIQPTAVDKGVQLTSNVARGLETILTDRDKLEKIILNLLFNSIKFTPAGGQVELSASAEEPFLVMRVKDTGKGIAEEHLPHIFDRFWQADSSAQRKYQGTGIGLALVKELAEALGGTVGAESRLGKGTTITVKIPLERTTQTPPAAQDEVFSAPIDDVPESAKWLAKLYRRAELFPAMTPLAETIHRDGYGGGKPKVLIADDEPDMLKFLKSQLQGQYEVLEAVDGNQAVDKARQFLPDLAILDMMMPEKDGISACREIKEGISTKAIPVILLTARADEQTKMSSLKAGASDFLTKPFSTTELHTRVKNLVDSHEFQKELAEQKNALESALEQLKDSEGQLVQNEKMASLGRLSAGLIHEINNPLNFMVSALHVLKLKKDKVTEPEREHYNEVVSDIENGVRRVQHIVSDLSSFAHPKPGMKELLDLYDISFPRCGFLPWSSRTWGR